MCARVCPRVHESVRVCARVCACVYDGKEGKSDAGPCFTLPHASLCLESGAYLTTARNSRSGRLSMPHQGAAAPK